MTSGSITRPSFTACTAALRTVGTVVVTVTLWGWTGQTAILSVLATVNWTESIPPPHPQNANDVILTLLYFCLPLIPLGALREERDVCLLHVGMSGQEGCYTEIVSL